MNDPHPLTATVKYAKKGGPQPVYRASQPGGDARLDIEGEYEDRTVEMIDGRARGALALDREGFELVDHASAVADFFDDAEIDTVYAREVAGLVLAATGGVRAHVFDHTRRAASAGDRERLAVREPASVIHNDYADRSAPRRVRDLLGDDAEDLLTRRFAIVNVWRPIGHAAETSMLALVDAATIAPDDVIPTERQAKDRVGEIHLASYNPAHRWLYFPAMRPDEALLLKTFDSATDGRARWSLHTAFDNPAPPPGAKPRQSIESRAFVFF